MDNTNTPKYCSFCGKPIDDTALLAVGMNGAICPDCVAIANKYITESKNNINEIILSEVPKPREIKKFLDQYIIGQDRVKERVAVAVYNHYKRINCNITDDVEIEKSNICIIGPTGSGKCISGNTKIKVRNKITGQVYYDTINNLKNMLISSSSK